MFNKSPGCKEIVASAGQTAPDKVLTLEDLPPVFQIGAD